MNLGIAGTEQVEEIGRGGFAVVYKAWQPAFERFVAIKVLSSGLDELAAQRFERECVAIGALSGHPNIVTVYDVGRTADERPYIMMEFLDRGSLADVVRAQGPLPWQEAVTVGVKLAGALESAHRISVLHRDVKPENVLLSRYGEPKLADFGIARIEGKAETRSGLITASPHHAPPEILNGARPSVVADVYSLGSTIFSLVTGHGPFDREDDDTVFAIYARIAADEVPNIREYDVPDPIATALEQALSKDPTTRPQSAQTFGEMLQEAQGAEGITATPLPVELSRDASATGSGAPRVTMAGSTAASAAAKRRGMTSMEERQRRMKRSFVISGVVVVVLIVGLVALLASRGGNKGGSPTGSATGTTVSDARAPRGDVVDDFSSAASGWEEKDDAEGRRTYENGHYVIESLKNSLAAFSFRSDAPSVNGSKTEVTASSSPTTKGFGVYGIACRYQELNGRSFYLGTISADGQWGIYRQRSGATNADSLAAGNTALSAGTHKLGFVCNGSPAQLQLLVDDKQVGTANDATPLPSGRSGLVVITLGDQPFAAVFDDFSFSRLGS